MTKLESTEPIQEGREILFMSAAYKIIIPNRILELKTA